MINYINDIAKENRIDRFTSIINILENNNIEYRIDNINNRHALGNIVVELNNKSLDDKIVVSAHFDNRNSTPGANDNATACSILLNLIMNFKDTDKHLEFIFFDLEEIGGIGSQSYLLNNKTNIKYAINLDMCGQGTNTVCATYNINNICLDNLISRNNVLRVNTLPFGDAHIFRKYNIQTIYIVNSDTLDLDFYRNYKENDTDSYNNMFKTEFFKTMHNEFDTIEKINFNQVELIYNFVIDIINNLV